MNPYLNQYRNTQVTTASPEQILIMLYDGAIRFLNLGIQGMEERDFEKRNLNINKAVAIVSEFRATLDHEVGGEIAANLDALYDFMIREMTRASIKNDVAILQPVLNILGELRGAWADAAEIVRKEKAAGKSPNRVEPVAAAAM